MNPAVLTWFMISLLYLGGIVAQVNFGRKKREILTEILEMTDKIERERREADHAAHPGPAHPGPAHPGPAHPGSAHPGPAHPEPTHHGQSHDHSRREAENPGHRGHSGHQPAHSVHGHSGHDQLGRGHFSQGHSEHEQLGDEHSGRDYSGYEHHGKDSHDEHPMGKDSQHEHQRKKRALIQAFIEEAKNITEADMEAGEHGTENPYENISSIIDQAHKIESAEDSKVDDDKSDNIPTVVEKEESSLMRFLLHEIFLIPKLKFSESLQVHTLNCQGPTGSSCSRGICTVACSDGAQVQMYCPSNSMVVKTRAVGELINQAEVSCGGGGEGKVDYDSVSNGFY